MRDVVIKHCMSAAMPHKTVIVTQQKVRRARVKRTLLTCFHIQKNPTGRWLQCSCKKTLISSEPDKFSVIKELWFWTLSSAVDSIFTILNQTFKMIKIFWSKCCITSIKSLCRCREKKVGRSKYLPALPPSVPLLISTGSPINDLHSTNQCYLFSFFK